MVTAIEKTGIKWKKKKWIEISAPEMFRGKKIGETFAKEIDKVLGCTVKATVAQLTGNLKKQNLVVTLKCVKFEGDKALTECVAFELERSYASRLVKKGCTKVLDSFVCETKDGHKVRIKPLMVTQSRAKSSIGKALHEAQVAKVTEYVKERTFNDIMGEIIGFKMQSALKPEFQKIFPVRQFQIKYFGLAQK